MHGPPRIMAIPTLDVFRGRTGVSLYLACALAVLILLSGCSHVVREQEREVPVFQYPPADSQHLEEAGRQARARTAPHKHERGAPPEGGGWHTDIIATRFSIAAHRRPRTAWNRTSPLRENPYHVALPFNDHLPGWESYGPCKNRWVEIVNVDTGQRAFGQWEDVGPWFGNDAAYVFDTADRVRPFAELHQGERWNVLREQKSRPGRRVRRIRNGAGIDLSFPLADAIGLGGRGRVHWRFVNFHSVADGPWKDRISTRPSR